ncbi:NAD-dependent epimerase/dehydratase family protein [Bordetella petrii]|uniref:NAD-dependent epimerase/dehydratase family protein n=1 Tax=Bordetella petrii TaxID=94624 RepID=UPI001A95AC42|nr:NAD-dependent epimerase/dehydratase family protein [Bordetella petrii]
MKLIMTGASGYIGQALLRQARGQGHQVAVYARRPFESGGIAVLPFGAPVPDEFRQADALINLAGRAHTTDAGGAHDAFDEANHQLPLRLAEQARLAGVRRFVHVSSIGVHGNASAQPLTETSPLAPDTPYTRSKVKGEQALQALYAATPQALAIVRPPMVYGPACPGNFARLRRLLQTGLPLPFGAIDARRSFMFVANLADFLLHCAAHPDGHGIYVAADGSDYAVPQLLRAMGRELGRPARLFPMPPAWLRGAARLAGLRREMDSLTRPLLVDWARARTTLGWAPPASPEAALRLSLA